MKMISLSWLFFILFRTGERMGARRSASPEDAGSSPACAIHMAMYKRLLSTADSAV